MSPLQKYHPWTAKAQSWDNIEDGFKKNWEGKHVRLFELVQHIKNKNLSQRLYGSTSMDKLVISIYDPLDYRKESLHITFDLRAKKWLFRYLAKPFEEEEFVRTYNEEDGIAKFDSFIKMINW